MLVKVIKNSAGEEINRQIKMSEITKEMVGYTVKGTGLIKEKYTKKTRSVPQKEYIEAKVTDGTATMELKIWDNNEVLNKITEKGNVVKYIAEISEYNGKLQLTVINNSEGKPQITRIKDEEKIEKVEVRLSSPPPYVSPEKTKEEFDMFYKSIMQPHLKALLEKTVVKEKDKYFRWYGAKVHHAYTGGLARHSLEVRLYATMVAKSINLPPEKIETVRVAAQLHDIGKLYYYTEPPEAEITIDGRLYGYSYIGARIVEKAIEEIFGFPEMQARIILHSILTASRKTALTISESTVGVEPVTTESIIIANANATSANVEGAFAFIENNTNENGMITKYDTFREKKYVNITLEEHNNVVNAK